jgi:hypothetical protein
VAPSVLYMSMSLDGYIAGWNDDPDNPGGDGFDRLHEWYGEDFYPEGPARQVVDEENAYGAIVVGRRSPARSSQGPTSRPTSSFCPLGIAQ